MNFRSGYIVWLWLLVLVAPASGQNQITHDFKQARLTYLKKFHEYDSFPITCIDDFYRDSYGRIWLTDCSTSQYNSKGLYRFDGYTFEFIEFTQAYDSKVYHTYTGIIDDKLFGYSNSPTGNALFYFDLKETRVVYYDTLNKGHDMSMFQDYSQELQNIQRISEDKIYNYSVSKERLKLTIHDKSTQLVASRTLVLTDFFKNLYSSYGIPIFIYDKEWFINFDREANQLQYVNILTGEKQNTELSELINTSEYYGIPNFSLNFSNDEQHSFNLVTKDRNSIYEYMVYPDGGIGYKELLSNPYKANTRVFKDNKGNSILLDQNGEGSLNAYLITQDNTIYDVSSIIPKTSHIDLYTLEFKGDNFLEAIFSLGYRWFSVQKIQTDSYIKTVSDDNSIRSIVSLDDDKFAYMYMANSDGMFKSRLVDLNGMKGTTTDGFCDFRRMYLVKQGQSLYGLDGEESLVKYALKNKTCRTFDFEFRLRSISAINATELVVVDKKTQFWLFNTQTESLKRLNGLSLASEFYYFSQDNQGVLWIASHLGLFKYDFETESLTDISELKDQFEFNFNSLIPLDNKRLLLGTYKNGLVVFDKSDYSHFSITTSEGLPHNTIATVTPDKEGYFWVGTYDGVALLDPELKHLLNLNEGDGIVHHESNRKSAVQLADGKIAIGSLKGISVLSPDRIKSDLLYDEPMTIYLTSVKYYNKDRQKDVPIPDLFNLPKELILDPSNNRLDVEFATSNLVSPRETSYSYKIEGEDNDWADLGTVPKLSLFGLASGNYTILIRGNNEGSFTQNTLSLDIRVEDYFYNEVWFYLLLLLMLTGVTFLWIRLLNYRVKHATQKINNDKVLIEQQAKRLEALDKTKTTFFTNITHEFRTPLTIIKSIVDLLRKNKNTDREKALDEIEQESNELLSLVNQILTLRKLEHKNMKIHLVQANIIAYIDYLIDSHQYLAQQKGIALHISMPQAPIIMDFDVEKTRIILSNLLSNAIKYTHENGTVEVEIYMTDNKLLHIAIKDNGKGISKDDLKQMFEYFQDSRDAIATEHSSGIGLSLTKKLVDLLDGEISLSSQENKGTIIKVNLPIRQNADRQELSFGSINSSMGDLNMKGETKSTAKDAPKILIIEDNASLRHILELQLSGFHTLTAVDGDDGIQKALANGPDLIISDVMMPGKNGFEVCERLKLDIHTSHIPIILLTAKAEQQSKIEGLKAKADAYIYKPYEFEELSLTINNLLESRALLKDIYRTFGKESTPTANPREDEFILRVKQLVLRQLKNENFDISVLCEHLEISRSGLHNKLKALTGLSTSSYILLVKLQEGEKLLKTTNMNINEISLQISLERSYFGKKFRKEFGVSPKEYRESLVSDKSSM